MLVNLILLLEGELLEVTDAVVGVLLGRDQHLLALLLHLHNLTLFALDSLDHIIELAADVRVFDSQVSYFLELSLDLTAMEVSRCIVRYDQSMFKGRNLILKVHGHFTVLFKALVGNLTVILAGSEFLLETSYQALELPLFKSTLLFVMAFLLSHVTLLELIAQILNFCALIDNGELKVRTFSLKLLDELVARGDLLLLLPHDCHHEVLLALLVVSAVL